jgi:hypothetical protein
LVNFAYVSKKIASTMTMDSITLNVILILFIACGSVCVIDDNTWDWKYAYVFIFTIGMTSYINGISIFIYFSNDAKKAYDAWQLVAIVYLQPLLFIEEAIITCLTT